MKTILFILMIAPICLFGQLNKQASGLKESWPNVYESIKYESVKKWGTDYEMTLYRINNQSESLVKLMYLTRSASFDHNIFFTAVGKWCDKDEESYNLIIFDESKKQKSAQDIINKMFELRCDWEMVEYEYNNQIKAKSAF